MKILVDEMPETVYDCLFSSKAYSRERLENGDIEFTTFCTCLIDKGVCSSDYTCRYFTTGEKENGNDCM